MGDNKISQYHMQAETFVQLVSWHLLRAFSTCFANPIVNNLTWIYIRVETGSGHLGYPPGHV